MNFLFTIFKDLMVLPFSTKFKSNGLLGAVNHKQVIYVMYNKFTITKKQHFFYNIWFNESQHFYLQWPFSGYRLHVWHCIVGANNRIRTEEDCSPTSILRVCLIIGTRRIENGMQKEITTIRNGYQDYRVKLNMQGGNKEIKKLEQENCNSYQRRKWTMPQWKGALKQKLKRMGT